MKTDMNFAQFVDTSLNYKSMTLQFWLLWLYNRHPRSPLNKSYQMYKQDCVKPVSVSKYSTVLKFMNFDSHDFEVRDDQF